MEQYLDTAVELAHYAGDIMRKNFGAGMVREWKADETPVTLSDKNINTKVIQTIQEKYPSHSIMGEEESGSTTGGEFLWVCDPIDGTFPFSHGLPISTFSLALVKDGSPLVGVLYDPYMDRLYSAIKGRGAFLNGQQIHVAEDIEKRPLIGMDWWAANGTDMLNLVRKMHDNSFTIMTLYSGAYQGALVASGKIAAYVGATDKAYDVAAQKIIIEEAGGVVTSLDGKDEKCDQQVNGLIAAPREVHKKILEIIQSA